MQQVHNFTVKDYIASEELQNSVNISATLGRPLLIKGEPGTENNVGTQYCRRTK